MPSDSAAIDRGMARGISSFRLVAMAWAWVGIVFERSHLDRPWLAIGALTVASALTLRLHVEPPSRRRQIVGLLVAEAAIGWGLLVIDGLVYDPFRQQSLPWAWPSAAIITAAVLGGLRWGLVAATAATLASFAGESLLRDSFQWTTGTASKSALFVLAAVVAAAAARRLRQAEDEISSARSREETARVLHDGVLQTLAAIARRSDDDSLRGLAADTERRLRSYIAAGHHDDDSLPAGLRSTAAEVAEREAANVHVAVADDLPPLDAARRRALVGAMAEAVTNAAKHSGASRIVVFADLTPDERGVCCSVRDDGIGFGADAPRGHGIEHSIHRRMAEVGGRVEIDSTPGSGTEVRLWLD